MQTKSKIVIAIALLVVAFVGGRYSVPKSVTTTKTEEDNLHKHTKTTIVDVTNPDGSKTHTITKDTDLNSDKKTMDSKETVSAGKKTNISVLASSKTPFIHPIQEIDYGVMVTRNVLGPISVGVFGFKTGALGVAAGISF